MSDEQVTEEPRVSNLERHAEFELRRAGLFSKESDYEGEVGIAVMELIKQFAGHGHSGYSAMMTLDVFTRLAKFHNLTPLTDDPEEWMEIGEDFRWDKGSPLHQNRRKHSCFSNDGGKTYYDIDGDRSVIMTADDHTLKAD